MKVFVFSLIVTVLNIFISFHHLKHSIYILASLFVKKKKKKLPLVLCCKSISGRCDDNNFQIVLRASLFWIPRENKPRGKMGGHYI